MAGRVALFPVGRGGDELRICVVDAEKRQCLARRLGPWGEQYPGGRISHPGTGLAGRHGRGASRFGHGGRSVYLALAPTEPKARAIPNWSLPAFPMMRACGLGNRLGKANVNSILNSPHQPFAIVIIIVNISRAWQSKNRYYWKIIVSLDSPRFLHPLHQRLGREILPRRGAAKLAVLDALGSDHPVNGPASRGYSWAQKMNLWAA